MASWRDHEIFSPLIGLGLFGINMHGFTIIFSWFSEARVWITFIAYPAFGMFAAYLYNKALFTR